MMQQVPQEALLHRQKLCRSSYSDPQQKVVILTEGVKLGADVSQTGDTVICLSGCIQVSRFYLSVCLNNITALPKINKQE